MRAIHPRDSHVTEPSEIRRLTGQNARILARLKQGPATARELAALSLKYTSRISDLRDAGYNIPAPAKAPNGLSTYYLVKPAPQDAPSTPHDVNNWGLR